MKRKTTYHGQEWCLWDKNTAQVFGLLLLSMPWDKAVEHLLLFCDCFDNINCYSQVYNIDWSEIVFRGQVVVSRELISLNYKHCPYPKKSNLIRFRS